LTLARLFISFLHFICSSSSLHHLPWMGLRSTWTLQTRSTSRLASLQISLFLSKPFIYFGFSTELLWFPVFFSKISCLVLFILFSRYIQGSNQEYNHIHLFLQVYLWAFCRSYSSVLLFFFSVYWFMLIFSFMNFWNED